jgi:hypothetical protein
MGIEKLNDDCLSIILQFCGTGTSCVFSRNKRRRSDKFDKLRLRWNPHYDMFLCLVHNNRFFIRNHHYHIWGAEEHTNVIPKIASDNVLIFNRHNTPVMWVQCHRDGSFAVFKCKLTEAVNQEYNPAMLLLHGSVFINYNKLLKNRHNITYNNYFIFLNEIIYGSEPSKYYIL